MIMKSKIKIKQFFIRVLYFLTIKAFYKLKHSIKTVKLND